MLSRREREVVLALAFRTQPCPLDVLGAQLYADLGEREAKNNVKVYVYRLRRRVGADFIVGRQDGYLLGPNVEVDFDRARRFLRRLLKGETLDADERETALALAQDLRAHSPEWLADREWFESLASTPQRLGRDLALLVGHDALRRGEVAVASSVGRELSYEDPCDEEVCDLLIRAQLHSGEVTAAQQTFRAYSKTLARHMQARPSPELHSLLGFASGDA
jgi:DNA-binding SARP family transcriptional activator